MNSTYRTVSLTLEAEEEMQSVAGTLIHSITSLDKSFWYDTPKKINRAFPYAGLVFIEYEDETYQWDTTLIVEVEDVP